MMMMMTYRKHSTAITFANIFVQTKHAKTIKGKCLPRWIIQFCFQYDN